MTDSGTLRILVCADLHIGRALHGRSLLDDQRHILKEILRTAREHHVQGLCLAGDIFDRSVPSTDAVRLADEFFTQVAGVDGITTLVIAGNHDSPERLDFGAGLLGRQGLHIHGSWEARPKALSLMPPDESFVLNLVPVPYAEPAALRGRLGVQALDSHQDAWSLHLPLLLEGMAANQDATRPAAHILVCHAYLAGGEESESERPLSIGAASVVDTRLFEGFDAVMAGHLHRQQYLEPRVWYPGSPLVYSASECGQDKYALLLEASLGTPGTKPEAVRANDAWTFISHQGVSIRVERLKLNPLRRVQRVTGFFQDLLAHSPAGIGPDDLLYVELKDTQPVFDAFARLQERYPGLLHLERPVEATTASEGALERRKRVEAGEEELIRGFIREMAPTDQSEAWMPLVKEILDQVRQGDASQPEGAAQVPSMEGGLF